MKYKLIFSKPVGVGIFLFLISLLGGYALLLPGFPPSHDGEYHIIRFAEFYKTFSSGQIFPRWAPTLNMGYGIPLFTYVYPLPNYIATIFHAIGISFIDSLKLSMFLAIFVGSVGAFFWVKRFFGDLSGLVASVFYTFSPYHFVDIYVRGSVGEVWALALFPWFLWAISEMIVERKKIFISLTSIFLAFIIFSHNILALQFFVFAITYTIFLWLVSSRSKKVLLWVLSSFLLGLGASAIFWLPAIVEKHFVVGLQIYGISISNFPDLYQLLIPSWGTGFSGGGLENQMSFQIGIANLIVVIFAVIVLIIKRKKDMRWLLTLYFIGWFFIVLFLLLPNSLFLWNSIPLMDYFQFPWRFLGLSILFCAFLAGAVVYQLRFKVLIGGGLIILCLLLGIGYNRPAFYHDRDDSYYLTRPNFIDGTNSIGNAFNTKWFHPKEKRVSEQLVFNDSKGKIITKSIQPTAHTFLVFADNPTKATLAIAYFPGWTIKVNGRLEKIVLTSDGLMQFNLPKGESFVEVNLVSTYVQQIAGFISLCSIGLILGILSYTRKTE